MRFLKFMADAKAFWDSILETKWKFGLFCAICGAVIGAALF